MNSNLYEYKYLKYKIKYLKLKLMVGGQLICDCSLKDESGVKITDKKCECRITDDPNFLTINSRKDFLKIEGQIKKLEIGLSEIIQKDHKLKEKEETIKTNKLKKEADKLKKEEAKRLKEEEKEAKKKR
jgi:hypothetical protein